MDAPWSALLDDDRRVASRVRPTCLAGEVLAERHNHRVRVDGLAGLRPSPHVDDLALLDHPLHGACWSLRGRRVCPRRGEDGHSGVADDVPVEAVNVVHPGSVGDRALDADLFVEGHTVLVDAHHASPHGPQANGLAVLDRRVAW